MACTHIFCYVEHLSKYARGLNQHETERSSKNIWISRKWSCITGPLKLLVSLARTPSWMVLVVLLGFTRGVGPRPEQL